ncbi:unnamed protein product [Lactuca saligna]|uniref:RRM domain-containing protein n=1 Tax=Lactuca saligna TaxID=75948 RepID=A0AA36E2K5_LACSI|nr:unnamed protein product [Lactuca saligna]
MDGHQKEGEWTEVRRRRKPTSIPGDETTFYVSNIPHGAWIAEIRQLFTKHGEVVDIYILAKKNSNGKHFAFVRFRQVMDVKALEVALQGIRCRDKVLEVNLAKHPRKLISPLERKKTSIRMQNQFRPPQNNFNGLRDYRSFAQVAATRRYAQPATRQPIQPPAPPPPPPVPPPPTPPILIKPIQSWVIG